MKIIKCAEEDYIIPVGEFDKKYFEEEFTEDGDSYFNALIKDDVYEMEKRVVRDTPVLKFSKIYDDERVNTVLLQTLVKSFQRRTNGTSYENSQECEVVESHRNDLESFLE